MSLRKLMKALHTLGAIGMAGGIAAMMLMVNAAPEPAASAEYLAMRVAVYDVSRSLVLPSMALVFLSGVLSMAIHFPFQNALWVWLKFGAGFLIFESMLATIDAPARKAVDAVNAAIAGDIAAADLPARIQDAWGAWWVILTLAALNVVLAVWRPRFRSKN